MTGAAPSDRVTLTLTFLDIPDPSTDCSTAALTVRDGAGADSPVVGTFCGHTVPPPITRYWRVVRTLLHCTLFSHGSSLHVSINNSRGLVVRFRAVYTVELAACGGELHSETGRLVCSLYCTVRCCTTLQASPGYPDPAPPGTACVWTITAAAGNTVRLGVVSLDLPSSQHCNTDYLVFSH